MNYRGIIKDLKEMDLPNSEEIEFYKGFYANFYEELLLEYKEDIELYKSYGAICGGKILELACGTGRVTIPLSKLGYQVVGIDISEDMIEILKGKIEKKARRYKDRISIVLGNICDFRITNKVGLAILPATTISLLYDDKDIINMMNCVYESLNDNGKFIFDIRLIDESKFVDGVGIPKIYSWENLNKKHFVIMQEFLDHEKDKAIINLYSESIEKDFTERKFSFTEKRLITDRDIKRNINNSKFILEREIVKEFYGSDEKLKFYILRK